MIGLANAMPTWEIDQMEIRSLAYHRGYCSRAILGMDKRDNPYAALYMSGIDSQVASNDRDWSDGWRNADENLALIEQGDPIAIKVILEFYDFHRKFGYQKPMTAAYERMYNDLVKLKTG